MRRRDFLALGGATLAFPRVAFAQQAQQVAKKRVAFGVVVPSDDADAPHYAQALRQGLAKHGWMEGQNLAIDTRWGAATPGLGASLAKELVALQPDVFVVIANDYLTALITLTTRPIVFAITGLATLEPLVANFAHPGGNMTGFTSLDPSIGGKLLSLLKELAPLVSTAGLLARPVSDTAGYTQWAAFEAAGRSAGVRTLHLEVAGVDEIPAALSMLSAQPNSGLVVPNDTLFIGARSSIIPEVNLRQLPTVWEHPLFAKDGGLMSYFLDPFELVQNAGDYAGLILNEANPGDLPVQLPDRFPMVINLRTARALGFSVPQEMVIRADEVIS